jgi:CheY-like chemotaxis protein
MPSTLLLADPNPAIQRIVTLTFAGENVSVVCVSDGDQAIARIAAEPPDIVLADVTLPGRDGYEVAAFVKGRPDLEHIPALLLAGALDPVDVARAALAGCDGVITKPFEPQQVVTRVRQLLGGAKGSPARSVPGVPRPIDRLIESRSADVSVRERAEASLRIVKHPSRVPAVTAADEAEPAWPEPDPIAPALSPRTPLTQVPILPTPLELRDDPLGDYLDRLDASIPRSYGESGSRSPSSRADADDERTEVPTLTSVLGDIAPRSDRSTITPGKFSMPKEGVLFGAAPVEPPAIRPVPAPTPRGVSYRSAELRSATRAAGREPTPPTLTSPAAPAGGADQHRSTVGNAFDALMSLDEADPDDASSAAPVTPPVAPPDAEPVVSEALVDAVAARVLARLAPQGIENMVGRIVAEVAERLVQEEIDRIRGRNRM